MSIAAGPDNLCLKNIYELLGESFFIPAYQRGQSIRMVERLSVLVSRMNRTQVAELDTYLLMKNLPTSGTLLVKARLAAAHHGLTKELPRASALETLLILESIKLESDNQVTQSQDLIHKSDEKFEEKKQS